MIDSEYIWQEFENRGLLGGEDHDEYSDAADKIADKKGIDLARFAYLSHDDDPQVWAPNTSDGKHGWEWIYFNDNDADSEFYYKKDASQQRLRWLLEIFDIPDPDEDNCQIDLDDIIL